MGRRDQDGHGGHLVGDVQPRLIEAEQVVGPGLSAAQEFVRVGRIDADLVAIRLQRLHRVFEMGKRRIRQAAEIDHIRAAMTIVFGTGEDILDAHGGGVDDLGEDVDVVFGHIRRTARPAEKDRNVLHLVGAALDRHAIMG